jgi:hypothetical protein
MKMILFVLAFVMTAWPSAFHQQDDSSKIVGVWKSLNLENGKPLAEVKIQKADDKLTGVLTLRDLSHEGKENLTMEFPLTNLAFDGKTLSFNMTLPEPEKAVTTWEFIPRGDEEARLAIVKENNAAVEDGPVFVMKRMKAN